MVFTVLEGPLGAEVAWNDAHPIQHRNQRNQKTNGARSAPNFVRSMS